MYILYHNLIQYMEICKYIEFGCPKIDIQTNLYTFVSLNLKSSSKWNTAVIYDTVNEQTIHTIINYKDKQTYHIQEKYDPDIRQVCLNINGVRVTDFYNEIYMSRYIIKIMIPVSQKKQKLTDFVTFKKLTNSITLNKQESATKINSHDCASSC